jgi:hypothetical protein
MDRENVGSSPTGDIMSNIKLKIKVASTTYEYTVEDDKNGVEIILSASTNERPTEFGLYIWRFPFGKDENQILTNIVEEITGVKVKSLKFRAGNGHGVVNVEYE